MLQLANRLHATHDPVSRKQILLKGLCEMAHGTGGSCVVQRLDHASNRQMPVRETIYSVDPSFSVPTVTEGGDSSGEPAAQPSVALLHKVHTLESTIAIAHTEVSATIRLYRDPATARRFTPRIEMVVHLFHSELTWIYQTDVVLTSPSAMSLAPRARQTLELLFGGLSEKQIASILQLSHNTVHHYVKSIHRHFGVSSRSELLARWVGK